jgi:hypothetical protein
VNLLYIAGALVGGFIFAKLIRIFGEFAMQALKRSEENNDRF